MVDEKEEKEATILDLFSPGELTQTNSGYKTICPNCGLQGGRTEGLIIFPETNTWFCHSSGRHGGVLELVALQNKIVRCIDCLETGEKRNVLVGEQFKETLDTLMDNYGEEVYDGILEIAGIRKSIQLPGDGVLISQFADSLVKKLKNTYEIFYREDIDEVVEVVRNGFRVIKPGRFITLSERYFKPWCRVYTKQGVIVKSKSMNQTDANIVLISQNFQDSIPKIKRIFTVPIPIIYNGELTFPRKGYDERFESWLNHNSPTISEIPLEEAKKVFYEIYNEFCFQEKQDYTNAISYLITPFLRGLFPTFNTRTPLFCWLANRERAGKDYGAAIQGLVLEGAAVEEPPICSGEYKNSDNSDELRKKILSAFIAGKKRLHFANNKGRLNNAVLEGVLTSKIYSDRILGKNESKTFSNELDFSISGNIGITLTPDLANRSRFIRLFLDIEDANDRNFRNPNLHSWVLENRDLIISAIFSIIKNWYNQKCPMGSIPFASYPEWASICGGVMESAGLGNPCVQDKKMSQGISLDEDTAEMKSLFEYVYDQSPDEWISKQQIKEIIQRDESIIPWIDWEQKSHQTKFGFKVDKFVGRILSDIRLEVDDLSKRPARRKYRFTREKANFDKKSIFGDDFVEKSGNVGNDGNLYPLHDLPYIYRIVESSKNVTQVTKVTKPKSDREVQFWESEECKSIKPNCTKEQILEWIKSNPSYDWKVMYDKFGVGSMKFENELKSEGLI